MATEKIMTSHLREWTLACSVASVLLILALGSTSAAPQAAAANTRTHFKLPKVFDFAKFKELYNKEYQDASEQLIRQKLFLSRATRAFVSSIQFRYGFVSEYLKINQRSDWTIGEIRASMMKDGVRLFGRVPSVASAPNVVGTQSAASNDQLIDEAQIERQLEDIVVNGQAHPGYQKIAEELDGAGGRRKRQVQKVRDISMDDLIGAPSVEESAQVEAKVVAVPASNNPNYQRPELMSFGAEQPEEMAKPLKSIKYYTVISENQREQTGEALKSIFADLAKSLTSIWGGGGDEGEEQQPGGKQQAASAKRAAGTSKPNEVFVDHRESGCFFAPRNQGDCGSCYAFAMTAQLEWMHCKETGQLTPFSEQFILDCGARSGLRGCDGGDVTQLAEFVYNFGVELGTTYPYHALQNQCPYPADTDPANMGYLKLNIGKTAVVPQESFGEFLQFSPMIVGVATNNTNFNEYGGGVASGAGCGPDEDHAMLLVGHGREENQEYWLLRNSHGPSFGEAGYYKLAKRSGCIRTQGFIFGSISGRELKMSPQLNQNRDELPLLQRAQSS